MATATSSMPPSYEQVTGGRSGMEFPLSFVDFIPAMIKPGGIFQKQTYERFGELMIKANNWLQANPAIKIKKCESLQVVVRTEINSDVSILIVDHHEDAVMAYVRGLRIWITSKTAADTVEPQQIDYFNVVPVCQNPGGFMSKPKFDTFDETITKLNAKLRSQPIPGRILNLETHSMEYSGPGIVDPDNSDWFEYVDGVRSYRNIIRLFYECAPPAYEQIGCVDFAPACIQRAGCMKEFVFEPFSAVVLKAQRWIRQQPTLQIANVQSIKYKIHSSSSVLDTQRTWFYGGSSSTRYVRILRVCCVSGTTQPSQPLTAFACKTFIPCQLTKQGACSPPTFETQSETMRRALSWLQATGANVISAETLPVELKWECRPDPDVTLVVDDCNTDLDVFVLRVYLDGYYSEPPPRVLPPIPAIGPPARTCCTLL